MSTAEFTITVPSVTITLSDPIVCVITVDHPEVKFEVS
jgi:hypothetical protein